MRAANATTFESSGRLRILPGLAVLLAALFVALPASSQEADGKLVIYRDSGTGLIAARQIGWVRLELPVLSEPTSVAPLDRGDVNFRFTGKTLTAVSPDPQPEKVEVRIELRVPTGVTLTHTRSDVSSVVFFDPVLSVPPFEIEPIDPGFGQPIVPLRVISQVSTVQGPSAAMRVSAGQSVTRAIDITLAMRSDERMGDLSLARTGLLAPNALVPGGGRSYFVESESAASAPVAQGSGFSGFATANFDTGDRARSGVAGDRGHEFSSNGMLAGVDYLRRDHWLVGAAFGYSSSDVTRNDFNDGVKSDVLSLAGYASLRPLPTRLPGARLTASLGYGWIDMDERRSVSDGSTQSAQLDSQSVSARFAGSYEVGGRRFSLRPEVGLQYRRSDVEEAQLSDSITSGAHAASALYASLGLSAQATFEFRGLRLNPQARFRWMASLDESYDAVVLRTDTDSFRMDGMRAEGDYFVVGGGLLLDFGRSLDANVSVDQVVGGRFVSATTLTAGLTYRF